MTSRLNRPLLFASATFAVLLFASESQACWCSRVYTACYVDPCYPTPVVTRSYFVPASVPVVTRSYYVPAPAPVALCPTTSCSTTNVERCYLEPQTAYTVQTQLEPQVAYVRRSYYDPLNCMYRSYLQPTTQYVQRSYQVPVTNWVQRCTTEPVTSCTTSYTAVAGSAYLVPGTTVAASYWTPDGIVYYPTLTTVPAVACPAPATAPRDSAYPRTNGAEEQKQDPPAPEPMPDRRTQPGASAKGSLSARAAPARAPVRLVPSTLAGTPLRIPLRPAR